ncbi:uncharacterized protein LOC110676197 [Aedes aegypti]|uniref:Uncharacterized protein n=1 Tax=Aedes aegypti TaxID=7159 RepID=A0A6I8U3W4_AEDAE|nr:uncharacterized protein LOC110676197 [Aedes aegypti]
MAKVVDLDYLKSISMVDLIKEENYTEYEYTEVIYCKGASPYMMVVGTHKQNRHRAVSNYNHQTLCNAIGQQCPFKRDMPDATGRAVSAVSILTPQGIRELSQILAALPKITLFDNEGGINVSVLVALIRWIPGMESVHMSYVIAMDDGVQIQDGTDALFAIMAQEHKDYRGESAAGYARHTSAVMACAAYAALLMVFKTINVNAVNQMDIFIDMRIRALCHILGLRAKSITWEKSIKPLFNEEDLRKLNSELGFFPRLKKALFVPVLDMFTPELQHMNLIFQETSMTIFSLIAEFWLTNDITRLHVAPLVLVELPKWLKAVNQLVTTYGSSWKFYKLIDPKGTLIAQSNFRTLGCAALSWKRLNTVQTGQASLAQLQGVKANPEFEKLAAMKLKPEFLRTDAKSDMNILRRLLADESPHENMNWSRVVKAIEEGEWVEGRDF